MMEKLQLALRYHQAGDLEQAARLYREILSFRPDNVPALDLLGVVYYQFGNYDLAIEFITKSLRLNENNPDAYNHLGSALKAKGQTDRAAACFQRAIALNPKLAEAYFNLGNTLVAKGQFDNAISHYRRAIGINPNFFAAYYNLGNALHDKGNAGEAIISYQEALKLNPDSADIYDALGMVFQERGEADQAIAYFKKAIELNPNFTVAYANLGKCFQEKGDLEEALTYYERALKLNSDHSVSSNLYNNMGVIYQKKGQFHESLAYYKKALELDPDQSGIYKNIGSVLHDVGLFDEATDNYRKALALAPGDAETYCNLGSVFEDKGQFDEAFNFYQKALQINPALAEAHWNISLAQLKSGNFGEGWKGYEWRLLKKDARPSSFGQPRWDGRSLKGKGLIVGAEQGVGDEIMFASCLPDVISQADLCVVECDKRLVPLLARSFPEASFIERRDLSQINNTSIPFSIRGKPEAADFQIRIGSLPKFLRQDFTDFPEQRSYLVPDHQKVILWRRRYEELGEGLKIGISWKGGSKPSVRLARSTVLGQWTKLFSVPGIHFINLQYGDCRGELGEAREKMGVTIHDWEDADPLKDLDDFAAQIAALDLVISVDNSTVHMAGALGIPVWTLLPFACDWRWMREFEDTPWYKSVRLLHQESLGNWNGVFDRISSTLGQRLETATVPDIVPQNSYKNNLEVLGEKRKLSSGQPLLSREIAYRCAVIIPVGPGHEKFYDECMDSINRASGKNKGKFSEIIPIRIDDLDGSLGRSRARNIGIKKAAEHGVDWIYFLDADDLMAPLAFEYVSPYLEQYDGVWGSIWTIERGETLARERPRQLPFLYRIEDVLSCDPFVTLQMGHFVRTSVALATLFNESLDTGEDFDYYLRVWEKYRSIKIPLPFFYNRRGFHSQGPRSATGREWRQQVRNIIKKRYLRGWTTSFYYRGKEITFFISNPSDLIQRCLSDGRFFEIGELEFIADNVRPQSVILEVGANVGNHAIFYEKFMDPGKIILIEPNTEAIRLLKKNLELNNCTKMDTSLLGIGAGKERGRFLIRDVQMNNLGAAYLEANPCGDIEVAPLDELIHEKIDFIKIDVENMEMDLLEGAQGIVAAYRPHIFIEVMNKNISDFELFLQKIDYRIKKKFVYVNAVNYFIAPDSKYAPFEKSKNIIDQK
jgi:FkbM family methyltransferase